MASDRPPPTASDQPPPTTSTQPPASSTSHLPHLYFACDYCLAAAAASDDPDCARIAGPIRYSWADRNVDCCAPCFASERVAAADRPHFVKIDAHGVSHAAQEQPCASAPSSDEPGGAADLELWLHPRVGAFQRMVDSIVLLLCKRYAAVPIEPHVRLSSGFSSRGAAVAAARAVAAAFRSGSPPMSLSLGALEVVTHETSSQRRCMKAAVSGPRGSFEAAHAAAEASRRETADGQRQSIWPPPQLTLLYYAGFSHASEREVEEACALAGGAGALVGHPFEPGAIAVWDVSARAEVGEWAKVDEVVV